MHTKSMSVNYLVALVTDKSQFQLPLTGVTTAENYCPTSSEASVHLLNKSYLEVNVVPYQKGG